MRIALVLVPFLLISLALAYTLPGTDFKGDNDMWGHKIINASAPANASDVALQSTVTAANSSMKSYVDANDTLLHAFTVSSNSSMKDYVDAVATGGGLATTGGRMTGNISMGGKYVYWLASPFNDTSAATKGYVDANDTLIDAAIVSANSSMKSYVDAREVHVEGQITTANNSLKNYVEMLPMGLNNSIRIIRFGSTGLTAVCGNNTKIAVGTINTAGTVIQAAINYAHINGGEIFMYPVSGKETWILDNNLTLYSGTHLIGPGKWNLTLQAKTSLDKDVISNGYMWSSTSARLENVLLKGFTVDQKGPLQSSGYILYLKNLCNSTIEDCRFYRMTHSAFINTVANNGNALINKNNHIRNCVFELGFMVGDLLGTSGMVDSDIVNCQFYHSQGSGVTTGACDGLTWSNIYVHNVSSTGGAGLAIEGWGNNYTLKDMFVNNFEVDGAYRAIQTLNEGPDATPCTGTDAYNIVITNFIAKNISDIAFCLYDAHNVSISNSIVSTVTSASNGDAVYINNDHGTCSDILVNNNILTGIGRHGVNSITCARLTVTNNIFKGLTTSGGYGVYIQGGSSVVAKNNHFNGMLGWVWTNTVMETDKEIFTAEMDLSGVTSYPFVYISPNPYWLAYYDAVYTEASSSDAGVTIGVGSSRQVDGTYFDSFTSETSKAVWYRKSYFTSDLSHTWSPGDYDIMGQNNGGKVGTGNIRLVLHLVTS